MMEYPMIFLSLLIAGICATVLVIWTVFKKERRKEFLREIGMLTLATLLSLSIGLFSLSVSARWQVKQRNEVTVVRLQYLKQEAVENRNRIASLIANYKMGEIRDIESYVLDITDADRFLGSESYYRCSSTFQESIQGMLKILKPLISWVRQSHGELGPMLTGGLFEADRALELCVQAIDQECEKMG